MRRGLAKAEGQALVRVANVGEHAAIIAAAFANKARVIERRKVADIDAL
jgi:hypothetical protein